VVPGRRLILESIIERAPEKPSSGAKGVNVNRILSTLLLLASLLLVSSGSVRPVHQDRSTSQFVDVAGSATWSTAIGDLAAQGYVHGREAGRFEPEASITRAEMCVLLLRAQHGPDYQPPAIDGEWWEAWTAEAEREGLTSTVTDPSSPATRAEAATLMWLAMGGSPP
jgi:hypothetical protein